MEYFFLNVQIYKGSANNDRLYPEKKCILEYAVNNLQSKRSKLVSKWRQISKSLLCHKPHDPV